MPLTFRDPAALAGVTRAPTRARDVLWFNRDTYALTALLGVAAIIAAVLLDGPLRWLSAVATVALIGGLVVSTLVAWWVFEGSGATRYDDLPTLLPAVPARVVNVTTGFDDTTPVLVRRFPAAAWAAVDLFDESATHDGSILRARRSRPPVPGTSAVADPSAIDIEPSADAVFLLMAAHEVRDPTKRRALFGAVASGLASDGRLIVVEHRRDLANALAFGPGVLHFFPRTEWIAMARAAGLELVDERSRTAFVSTLVFARA